MNWPIFAALFVVLLPVVVWRIRRAVAVEAAIQQPVADLGVCERLWAMDAYDPDAADHTTTTTEGD